MQSNQQPAVAGPGGAPAALALSSMAGRDASVAAPSPLYLYGPTLDLVVIGGGLSLVVIPFAMLVSPVMGAMVFMLLNLVCNYPHYMATNYRVYGSAAQVRRYRFFAIYVTSFIVLLAVASHFFVGPWVNLLVVAYLFLGPYHYTGQNYGISLMYARRGGLDVSLVEKRLLYASGIAFMLTYLMLITVRPMGITPSELAQLRVPPDIARIVHIALVVIGLGCGGVVIWRMARRANARVLAPVIFLLVAQFAWFALPSALVFFNKHLWLVGLNLALFVPAINFLHCAQYLGVTAYYTKRERAGAGQPFHLGHYLLVLVVGGALLWSVGMRIFSEAFAVDYAVSVLALNALINIHHYVLDGAIWKLRDGRIARLLIAGEAAKTPEIAPPPVAPAPRSRFGRGVAWAAVACLAFAVFGADAMRGYMLLQAGDLRTAQKWGDAAEFYNGALRYNGRTADALEGLAIAAMQAGDYNTAATHWAESIRLNPISSHLRDGLGETYLRLGRVDDAIAQLEEAVRMTPNDEIGLRLLAQGYWSKGDRDRARTLAAQADTVAAEADRLRQAL